MFREDAETKAVALIGEIGGNAEEQAAEYIRRTSYPKPIAGYIAGRTAPPGKRMGHAGAIITGSAAKASEKVKALSQAGATIAPTPAEVGLTVKKVLGIFDIVGPIMVGPSSSHTAGAVRIGLMAGQLTGYDPVEIRLQFHGSLAEVHHTHFTDAGVLAGLMGFQVDDERIRHAFDLAKGKGSRSTAKR
jgi:hypothetical protein